MSGSKEDPLELKPLLVPGQRLPVVVPAGQQLSEDGPEATPLLPGASSIEEKETSVDQDETRPDSSTALDESQPESTTRDKTQPEQTRNPEESPCGRPSGSDEPGSAAALEILRVSRKQKLDEASTNLTGMIGELRKLCEEWDEMFRQIKRLHPLKHTIPFAVHTSSQRVGLIMDQMPKALSELRASYNWTYSKFMDRKRVVVQNFDKCIHIATDLKKDFTRLKDTSPPPADGKDEVDLGKLLQKCCETTEEVIEKVVKAVCKLRIIEVTQEEFQRHQFRSPDTLARPVQQEQPPIAIDSDEEPEPPEVTSRRFYIYVAAVCVIFIGVIIIDAVIVTAVKNKL